MGNELKQQRASGSSKEEAAGTERQVSNRSNEGLARIGSATPSELLRNPFSFLRRFSEDMDQLFDDWLGGGLATGRGGQSQRSSWWPQVEIRHDGNTVTVCADLPGMRKEDVKVEVEDDVLTIQGERRQEQEHREHGVRHSERSYGSFSRTIRLPRGVDSAKATAEFRDGVLTVTVPAPAAAQRGRRIAIQDASQSKTHQHAEDQPHGKAV